MEIKIVKMKTQEQAKEASRFLEELISFETKYDPNMKKSFKVKDAYYKAIGDNNKCVLLAIIDNEYVGYIDGFIQDMGSVYKEKVAFLEALYVKEKYRNKKVGQHLIEGFLKWTKLNNVNYIEVTAFQMNEIAVHLYKKIGFKDFKTTLIKAQNKDDL